MIKLGLNKTIDNRTAFVYNKLIDDLYQYVIEGINHNYVCNSKGVCYGDEAGEFEPENNLIVKE